MSPLAGSGTQAPPQKPAARISRRANRIQIDRRTVFMGFPRMVALRRNLMAGKNLIPFAEFPDLLGHRRALRLLNSATATLMRPRLLPRLPRALAVCLLLACVLACPPPAGARPSPPPS